MGERGPAKEPLALKISKGTDRPEDRQSMAAAAPAGLPEMPEWLHRVGSYAVAVWEERIEALGQIEGLLSLVDGPALASYCVAWQRIRDAQEVIAAEGLTCVGSQGGTYQHPAVGVESRYLEIQARIGAKFGMTPSDLSTLHLSKPKEQTVRRRIPG